MPREMTDAEVFGSGEMSDADVFGSPARPPAKPARKPPTLGQEAKAAAWTALRAFPLGDEISAAGGVVDDFIFGRNRDPRKIPQRFDQHMDRIHGSADDFTARRPKAAGAAAGTGIAASLLIPGGAAVNTTRGVNAARGAVTAGLYGGGYAAADRGTLAERGQAAVDAMTNPLTYAAGGAIGAAIPPALRRAPRQRPPQALTPQQLEEAKGAAYKAVDQAGVRYRPEAFSGAVDDISATAQAANLNPIRHPKAASMLDDMSAMKGQAPTLTEVDQLRQVVNRDVSRASDDAEAFFGKRMTRGIDDFVGRAGPDDVLAGDPVAAAGLINRARDLNTRFRKVESVTDALDAAKLRAASTNSGGNIDNAIRQNMRRVLEDTPNLTAEEEALLRKIVMGGRGQNVLRLFGKLSPQGNGLMAAGNLASAATMGPAGAVPGGLGMAAKFAADRMTEQRVNELVRLMAAGGTRGQTAQRELQAAALQSPEVAALYRQALARLTGVAGAAPVAAGASTPR